MTERIHVKFRDKGTGFIINASKVRNPRNKVEAEIPLVAKLAAAKLSGKFGTQVPVTALHLMEWMIR